MAELTNEHAESGGQNQQAKWTVERTVERSPNYPVISLEEAIARAKRFRDVAGRGAIPVPAAAKAWGFSEKSSGGRMIVSALVKFGLLEESGRGANRSLRLAPLAFDILLDERPESEERAAAIRRAALTPKIHADLWSKWQANLPSDPDLRTYLLKDLRFTEAGVNDFIKEYKETIAFAKLTCTDDNNFKTEGHGARGAAPNPQPVPGEPSPPQSKDCPQQATSRAAEPPAPQPPKQAPPSRRPPMQTGTKEDVFTLEEGQVILQWPERMSQESFEDFESWLQLVIRKARRSVRSDQTEGRAEGGE
jgi:hypothetical protein